MAVAPVATKLLPVVGPRPLMVGGPIIVAAGLLLLSRITADGDYFAQVLPGLIVMGVGMALVFVPLQNLALTGVAPHDAGVASATANATMQIGGSIGLSVFTALAASATASAAAGAGEGPAALTSGYAVVFLASAVAMVLAAVIAAVFIRGSREQLMPSAPEGAAVVHMG
jgi:uncharacterized membrane protein